MLDLKSVALRVLDGSPRELRRIEERRHDAEAGRGAEAAMSRMFLHLNRIADLYERLGHDVSLQKSRWLTYRGMAQGRKKTR